MRSLSSVAVLRSLHDAGLNPVAVVMPGLPGVRTLPPLVPSAARAATITLSPAGTLGSALSEPGLDQVARAEGIPVLSVGGLKRPDVVESIATLRPDLVVVACYPRRIPPALLRLPRYGWLNIHPSLLPKGRGPEPLFWTVRRGEPETGVTIHLMDPSFDSGPILVQARMPIPDGIRLPDLDRQLSELGAQLIVPAISGLIDGTITPTPQDEQPASDAPFPEAIDFVMTPEWSAAKAYAFARAVAPLNGPLAVRTGSPDRLTFVRDAIGWRSGEKHVRVGESGDDDLWVPFRDGSVGFVRMTGASATPSHHKI